MSEFTYTPEGTLDQFRAQMHAALPAGLMVEQLLAQLLAEARTAPPDWVRDPGVPVPNMASASTVLRHAIPASVEAVAVVAGMQDRLALRELLEAYEAGQLPGPLYLALLSNPVLVEMNATVRIPHPMEAARWVSREQLSVITIAILDAVLAGRHCHAEKVHPTASSEAPVAAENLYDWKSLDPTHERLVRTRLPGFNLAALQLSGRKSRPPEIPPKRTWKETLLGFGRPLAKPAPLRLDAGPLYESAVRTVWDPTSDWREHLRTSGRCVVGRQVGRKLYAVTGDDAAHWTVAADLLNTWDASLPEWLETVRALA